MKRRYEVEVRQLTPWGQDTTFFHHVRAHDANDAMNTAREELEATKPRNTQIEYDIMWAERLEVAQ